MQMIIYMDDRPHTDFGLTLTHGQVTQMMPPVKRRTKEIVGRNGSYHSGSDLGARTFSFPFIFAHEATQEALESRITAFADFLTDDRGRPRKIKLNLSAQPNRFYTVEVSDAIDMTKQLELGEFTLKLVADDPHAYSDLVSYTFVHNLPNVNVVGSLEAFPVFKITCKSAQTQLILRCGTGIDMREIRLNHTFKTNDIIEIDCSTGKITLNGVRAIKYLAWQTSKFFALQPGLNPMQISPSYIAFTTTMTYTPRWG